MKNIFAVLLFSMCGRMVSGQDTVNVIPKQDAIKKKDNYTVQYLIIFNEKGEVLLQRNTAGWHTLAIRSNENQSVKEALDSLANSIGITIRDLKLAGLIRINLKDFLTIKRCLLELILQQDLEAENSFSQMI